ncbi:Arc family DNA-binding protein [Rhizobium ruizarguesonis]|uniref:Arc family DNA-binding protein n=1 Tax=Rhizobium ruizarguesonis TaxID=2081791 RepID=UPI00163A82ED|nr:Arc family DNA-binding protein [Rhizobium ruizarguesonis]
MIRLSTSLPDELFNLLQSRADINKRSMNKEVIFLLEAALAAEHGDNLALIRTMMIAQGGLSSLSQHQ